MNHYSSPNFGDMHNIKKSEEATIKAICATEENISPFYHFHKTLYVILRVYETFLLAKKPAVACPTYHKWNPAEGRQDYGEYKTMRAWDNCFLSFHRY